MFKEFLKNTKTAWRRDWARHIRNHAYDWDDNGHLLIKKAKFEPLARAALAPRGRAALTPLTAGLRGGGGVLSVGDGGVAVSRNLWVTEGRNFLLDVSFRGVAAAGTWYVAVASGNVTPLATWTAANFTANATELTTEISNATRPEYDEAAASAGSMTNAAAPAVITSAEDAVTIWIVGLLSSSTKGGTTGKLMAATKYASSYTLPTTGDQLSISWALNLTAT